MTQVTPRSDWGGDPRRTLLREVNEPARIIHNDQGNYRFIALDGRPFSGGAVADPGYDIVHARFVRPVPLEQGLKAAERVVAEAGRPVLALAGFELRIPAPMTIDAFATFNQGYVERLRELGLHVDALMPAARTNVAVAAPDITEPSLYALSYTTPTVIQGDRKAFVLSGIPEEERSDPATMLDSIMNAILERMTALEVSWDDVTEIQIYGVELTQPVIEDRVLRRAGRAAVQGIHWFPALPPIDSLTLEVDVRGAGTQLILESGDAARSH